MENGDVRIYPNSGRGAFAFILGLPIALFSLWMLTVLISDFRGNFSGEFLLIPVLFVLGGLLLYFGVHAQNAPEISIDVANRLIHARARGSQAVQTWPFEAMMGPVNVTTMGFIAFSLVRVRLHFDDSKSLILFITGDETKAQQVIRWLEATFVTNDVGEPVDEEPLPILNDQVESPKKGEAIVRIERQIDQLYDDIAVELSDNRDEAMHALEMLGKARIMLGSAPDRYDEALDLVSTVKTMIDHKRNKERGASTWGKLTLVYTLIWFIVLISAMCFDDRFDAIFSGTGAGVNAVGVTWLSALAGGIGAVVGSFYSLYWHMTMKQDFRRQYVMVYLVRPFIGLALGGITYFIIQSGLLIFAYVPDQRGLFSPNVAALQLMIGWIVGFRQPVISKLVAMIVHRLASKKITSN
jgi:hypothetical protein